MTETSGRAAVDALLADHAADPTCTWSLGAFGALATFAWDPDEAAQGLPDGCPGRVTRRGALALAAVPDLVPFAYETGFADGWSQAVALCLPAGTCAMGGRTALTELGPDGDAVRPEDRGAILFDLGLGLRAAEACLRVADPALVADLRAATGRAIVTVPEPAPADPLVARLVMTSPHRVFRARIGRIEVYTPIAGTAPGPRTVLAPNLLRLGRTHAATAPIPAGLVPCATLHPAHPARDGAGRPIPFVPARHESFGALLDAWGDPVLTALRRAVLAGRTPDPDRVDGRFARSAIRAAQAQLRAMRG